MSKTTLAPWVKNQGASNFKIDWKPTNSNQFPTVVIGTEDVTGNKVEVIYEKERGILKLADRFFFEARMTYKGEILLDVGDISCQEAQEVFFKALINK